MNNETWLKRNVVTIVGFIINLVFLGVYIGRQSVIIETIEKRTTVLEGRMNEHHEDKQGMHVTPEWRASILQRLDRIDGKLDAHIMEGTRKQ